MVLKASRSEAPSLFLTVHNTNTQGYLPPLISRVRVTCPEKTGGSKTGDRLKDFLRHFTLSLSSLASAKAALCSLPRSFSHWPSNNFFFHSSAHQSLQLPPEFLGEWSKGCFVAPKEIGQRSRLIDSLTLCQPIGRSTQYKTRLKEGETNPT